MQIRDRAAFFAIPVIVVVLGVAFILFDAANVGLWAWVLVGVVGLAAASVLAIRALRRGRAPGNAAPHRMAPEARDGGPRRVLLILDETCRPTVLWRLVRGDRDAERIEVLVIAPALGSRIARVSGDERAYAEATRRLDATLRALADLGVDASGQLGSHDAIQAADDGLREFAADEVVFAVRAADRANWLARDAETVARRRYAVPVRAVVIEASGPGAG